MHVAFKQSKAVEACTQQSQYIVKVKLVNWIMEWINTGRKKLTINGTKSSKALHSNLGWGNSDLGGSFTFMGSFRVGVSFRLGIIQIRGPFRFRESIRFAGSVAEVKCLSASVM